jgi:hypothetical protein
MHILFFSVREWNRFSWNMQEVICKKYDVILTDYQTRKEKIMLLLHKINMKNFNKGMDTFNKSLNKFSKTVDSMTASANKSSFKGFDQGKSMDGLGKSKNEIWGESNTDSVSLWGKPIRLTSQPVSIWPEKPTKTESKSRNDMDSIWGKRDDG